MKEKIFKIIQDLTEKKILSKKAPVLILDQELQAAVTEEVLECIRELWKEKKIDLGKTINNNYIKIREPNSPPRRKVHLHPQSLQRNEPTKKEIPEEKKYKCTFCEYEGDKDLFKIDVEEEKDPEVEDITCDNCHDNFRNE